MSGFLDKHYAARTVEEVATVYDAWASTYESELAAEQYAGARSVAEVAARVISDANARILDVGCGTGLVGEHLAATGFSNVYGTDLSPGMLDEAREKGCYRELQQADLLQPIRLRSAPFDVVVSAGLFTLSLLGPDVLSRVLNLVRTGGMAVIGINATAFEEQDYEESIQYFAEKRSGTLVDVREMPYWPGKEVASKVVIVQL